MLKTRTSNLKLPKKIKKPKKPKLSDKETSFSFQYQSVTTSKENSILKQWGGCLNLVSRFMLEERNMIYSQFKTGNHSRQIYFNAVKQSNNLSEIKQIEGYEFLSEVPAQLYQQKAMELDNSFSRFFEGLAGYPKPRSRNKHGFSMKFPDAKQFSVEYLNKNNAQLKLPKGLVLRFKTGGRRIPKDARIRSCMIKGNSAGTIWTISFNLGIIKSDFETILRTNKIESKNNARKKDKSNKKSAAKVENKNIIPRKRPSVKTPRTPINLTKRENPEYRYPEYSAFLNTGIDNRKQVGIDRGIAIAMQLSDGSRYNFPNDSIKKLENRIKFLQRLQSNKKMFSKNWRKGLAQINKIQTRIVEIRKNWIHKTTTAIAKNHSLVAIEDLKLANMTKSAKGTYENPGNNVSAKSGLNKSLLRVGMGEQGRQLEYKTKWYKSFLVKVNPRYTSCECRICNFTSKENRKSQSKFLCLKCGHEENADLNASKIVLARGHRVLVCGEAVSKIVGEISDLSTGTSAKQKPKRHRNLVA